MRPILRAHLALVSSSRRPGGSILNALALMALLANFPEVAADPSAYARLPRPGALERAFPWDHGVARSGSAASRPILERIDEIVAALKSESRDQDLARLGVPRVLIGPEGGEAEKWWDLRGATFEQKHDLAGANLTRLALDETVWKRVSLIGADLGGVRLRGAVLDNCDLELAQVDNALLDHTLLSDCNLTGANFRSAEVIGRADFRLCRVDRTRFDAMQATGSVTFAYCTGSETVFRFAVLDGLKIVGGELTKPSFLRTSLRNASFDRCRFVDADFSESDLGSASFQGVSWSGILSLVRARVGGVFLGDLSLEGADIRYLEWPARGLFLGEDLAADVLQKSSNDTRIGTKEVSRLYSQAETSYRYLSGRYQQAGYLNEAILLRYRALETRRKLLALERPTSAEAVWLFLSGLLSGHGCKPWRLVASFLGSLAVFTTLHFALSVRKARQKRRIAPAASPADGVGRLRSLPAALSNALGGILGPASKVLEFNPLIEVFSPREPDGSTAAPGSGAGSSTTGRILVAVEAIVGLLLFWLAFRTAVIFTSV